MPNSLGTICQVNLMDTMTGAGNAVLGVLSQGSLATVCASSQSLIEMLPVLKRLVSQRLCVVFHTTVTGLNSNLQISSDYASIFPAAFSGAAMISSFNVQEAHDIALVSHLASRRAALPFIHFFDHQIAHELSKIKLLPQTKLSPLWGGDREVRVSTMEKRLIPDAIDDIMFQLRRVLKRRYRLFEYVGVTAADFVIVSFCSGAETTALEDAVNHSCKSGAKIGLIKVRLLRPWSSKHFLQAFPTGMVKRCSVVSCGPALKMLHADVLGSIPHLPGCAVTMTKIEGAITVSAAASFVGQALQGNVAPTISHVAEELVQARQDAAFKKLIAWNQASNSEGMLEVAEIIGDNTSTFVHAAQLHDAYSHGGIASMTHLHVAPAPFTPPGDLAGLAQYVTVQDIEILKHFDVLEQLADKGTVVLNAKDLSVVPPSFQQEAQSRQIRLITLDPSQSQADVVLVFQIAVLLLTITPQGNQKDVVHALRESVAAPLAATHSIDVQLVHSIIDDVALQMKPVELKSSAHANEDESPALPSTIRPTLFSVVPPKVEPVTMTGEHAAVWRLMFPEAYDKQHCHAPSGEEKFVIKVKENRRLTPNDYDRNVFHMELDTSNTKLTYEIGDALGVYPHNQEQDVNDFMSFYGLKATDAVTFLNQEKGTTETRTVDHILTQVLDLFGRPPRTFYTSLADYATNPDEKAALLGLGGEQKSAKWDAEYKKQSDGLVNFADILRQFPSAHPPFIDLVRIVSPTKPRHYSIASARSFKPNSVDLLIVLVSWQTAKGETRYGQATRYLVDAKVGTSITVSVKPSVMKLPEDPLAPVLMAGLGTGMAPFRAFIQERAVQHNKGLKVGPMALYFGSRSQFEEYLYGEELEAYHNSGLLTLLRCAFSRDQPKKVYIQHKIDEDGRVIHEYLAKQAGQFYLCGPTWPCGDVQDAITGAFQRYGNISAEKAAEEIALLKEHERYILEVY